MTLSVVVPTLNAEAGLAATLAAIKAAPAGLVGELVVSDGGSTDRTRAIAQAAGCLVVDGPAGRGAQLIRGAATATGDWLLFLHADTVPEPGWAGAVAGFMRAEPERAAVFRFALDDDGRAARALEAAVRLRVRLLALPYGDQGLLIPRALYDRLGGFAPVALMEDVDLVRRIGRERLRVLPATAVTSAARYRRDGYLRRSLRNAFCLTLYLAGVPPERIARIYG